MTFHVLEKLKLNDNSKYLVPKPMELIFVDFIDFSGPLKIDSKDDKLGHSFLAVEADGNPDDTYPARSSVDYELILSVHELWT